MVPAASVAARICSGPFFVFGVSPDKSEVREFGH
jgi:hypothetical protein